MDQTRIPDNGNGMPEINGQMPIDGGRPPRGPKKKHKWLRWLILFLILVGVLIGAYFYHRSKTYHKVSKRAVATEAIASLGGDPQIPEDTGYATGRDVVLYAMPRLSQSNLQSLVKKDKWSDDDLIEVAVKKRVVKRSQLSRQVDDSEADVILRNVASLAINTSTAKAHDDSKLAENAVDLREDEILSSDVDYSQVHMSVKTPPSVGQVLILTQFDGTPIYRKVTQVSEHDGKVDLTLDPVTDISEVYQSIDFAGNADDTPFQKTAEVLPESTVTIQSSRKTVSPVDTSRKAVENSLKQITKANRNSDDQVMAVRRPLYVANILSDIKTGFNNAVKKTRNFGKTLVKTTRDLGNGFVKGSKKMFKSVDQWYDDLRTVELDTKSDSYDLGYLTSIQVDGDNKVTGTIIYQEKDNTKKSKGKAIVMNMSVDPDEPEAGITSTDYLDSLSDIALGDADMPEDGDIKVAVKQVDVKKEAKRKADEEKAKKEEKEKWEEAKNFVRGEREAKAIDQKENKKEGSTETNFSLTGALEFKDIRISADGAIQTQGKVGALLDGNLVGAMGVSPIAVDLDSKVSTLVSVGQQVKTLHMSGSIAGELKLPYAAFNVGPAVVKVQPMLEFSVDGEIRVVFKIEQYANRVTVSGRDGVDHVSFKPENEEADLEARVNLKGGVKVQATLSLGNILDLIDPTVEADVIANAKLKAQARMKYPDHVCADLVVKAPVISLQVVNDENNVAGKILAFLDKKVDDTGFDIIDEDKAPQLLGFHMEYNGHGWQKFPYGECHNEVDESENLGLDLDGIEQRAKDAANQRAEEELDALFSQSCGGCY